MSPHERRVALIMLVVYFVVGIIVYTRGGWSSLDTLYFLVVTLTTVGYGDYHPHGTGEMVLTCIFSLVGVMVIATALGVVLGVVLDKEEEWMLTRAPRRYAALWRLAVAFMHIGCVILVGSIAFGVLEGRDAIDSIYWSCITVTTIGYGDQVPQTRAGKWFAIMYIIVGTLLVAKAMSEVVAIPLDARRARIERRVQEQFGSELSAEELAELRSGQSMQRLGLSQSDEFCTRAEFSLALLVKLGKVDEDDLKQCYESFAQLDTMGDGRLDHTDVCV